MGFWQGIRERSARSVAVFGLAKNAGKTVALNRLVDGAVEEGVALGLTSIGRDGETWDVLTHRRKPAVRAVRGTFLATAEACLRAGTARLEVLDRTEIATPMGPVLLARVLEEGTVEVAGPSRTEPLRRVVRRLEDLGAGLVLVDGAIDRQSLASPRVTEGCVLATGAVLSEDMDEVVRVTEARVRQLTLHPAAPAVREAWRPGKVIVLAGGKTLWEVEGASILKDRTGLREHVRGGDASVLVGGALTDAMVEDLMGGPVRIVVRDATCLFVDGARVRRFEAGGGILEVVSPLKLLAVTVNPVSPEGWTFPARTFFDAVSRALGGVPVYDVVAGFEKKGSEREEIGLED